MSKTAARLALLFALVGLGASATAAYVHYRLLYDPTYLSFCDVSATISCTQVYASRYSTVAGVPVAILGGVWFAGAALLSVAGLTARPAVRESVPGYLFLLSTLALSVILYLAYLSFFVLSAVCVVCLTTYAAVIGLFIVSGAATRIPMSALPRRAAADLRIFAGSPAAIALVLLFATGAGTALAFFPREATPAAAAAVSSTAATSGSAPGALPAPTEEQRAEFERWFVAQPRVPVAVDAEGAKVLIVKFNDFQCPPCRQSHMAYLPIIKKLQAEHPGQVRYVLKDFPLEAECNPTIPNGGPHPSSCEAAVAVRLAREQGHEDAMIEWIFANQPQLTPQLVKQGLEEVGKVAPTDFDTRYQSTLTLVKADAAQGQLLQVRSTPTFFIDGVKVEGALPPQYFEQALQYELEHAK
ncbi:MAG: thioredoxin domain-containing protein [Acidobacteria bacterium]|nr:thioredoxin domain-containing protein [Acidobacteriota bacterium]